MTEDEVQKGLSERFLTVDYSELSYSERAVAEALFLVMPAGCLEIFSKDIVGNLLKRCYDSPLSPRMMAPDFQRPRPWRWQRSGVVRRGIRGL